MKNRRSAKRPPEKSFAVHRQPQDVWDDEMRDRIATKAYEFYEQRGRVDGQALDDWLKAEATLNGRTD